MMTSDILIVLQWWLTIFILGIGFLPLTFFLFDKFFDKGYIFSKIIGLGITSYLILVIGMLHVIPFSLISSYGIFLLTVGAFFFLLPNRWKILFHLKRTWRILLFEELFFLGSLFFWSYIHSFSPDIHGLEKYMDYGFINSILRTEFFPPKDMWLAPFSINYYYFGHLMTAVLTQLSLLPSQFTFNLMLATIFAWCAVETFSLGANLYSFLCKEQRISPVKRFFSGILTASLVTMAGNLHVLYAFFKPYETDKPLPFWQLAFLPESFPNSYWYPNATRYIYHTIHEFPIYSWVVADLHGHVLDIPFVLLIIGILLALFMKYDPKGEDDEQPAPKGKSFGFLSKTLAPFFATFTINPLLLTLIGFLLSVMYMTNAWDGAIYLLLTSFIILFIHWQKRQEYQQHYLKEDVLHVIKDASAAQAQKSLLPLWFVVWGRDTLLSILYTVAAFVVFTVPYNLFFKPFVSGIGVLCAPEFLTKIEKLGPFLFEKDHCQHSYWWELMVLYGFFYFFVVVFLIVLKKTKKIFFSDIFVLLLIVLGTLLIILPEDIYVKDIYPAHYRANTMFKLVFQSFIMLGISSAYIIARLMWVTRPHRKIWFSLFSITTIALLVAVLSYPQFAINSYYGNLTNYKGLDGTKYLQTLYPSDYEAIQWLNTQIKGQPVILEAQGDSYTDYARVSANTGLPTVLGWTVHEWLWRGSYDIPSPRINDIQKLYDTTDVTIARALLKKYDVEYIFVGAMEYQKYPQLSEEKFKQLGTIVFEKDTTKIYKVTE